VSGVGVPLVVENTPISSPHGEDVTEGVGVLDGVLDGVALLVVLGVGELLGVLEGVLLGVFDGVLLGVGELLGVLEGDKEIQGVSADCIAPPEFTPKK